MDNKYLKYKNKYLSLKMNTNHPNRFSITTDSTPFTIAEAGLNHNGEIKKALEMEGAIVLVTREAIK